MKDFKFAMNAAVMLVTSLPAHEAEARNKERLDTNQNTIDEGIGAELTLLEYHGPIEAGHVIARAEYVHDQDHYLVRYRGGDNRQVENWIGEDALVDDPRSAAATA